MKFVSEKHSVVILDHRTSLNGLLCLSVFRSIVLYFITLNLNPKVRKSILRNNMMAMKNEADDLRTFVIVS